MYYAIVADGTIGIPFRKVSSTEADAREEMDRLREIRATDPAMRAHGTMKVARIVECATRAAARDADIAREKGQRIIHESAF